MTINLSLPFNLTPNTVADATQVMANFNAGVAAFLLAASAGANVDITSLGGLTTPLGPGQGGSVLYVGGTSTGSANAQVVTPLVPAGFTLAAGKQVAFIAGFTNTGALTLNAASSGVTSVFRQTPNGPQALTGGEVVAGTLTICVFDGTRYELITRSAEFGGFGPFAALASAATADLGSVPTHNVNITGTTTITAFGSSASTTYPFYLLTFAGILVLTHGASLVLPGAANITTAANDSALAVYLGAGAWQVLSYSRATAPPASGTLPTVQNLISGTVYTPTSTAVKRIRVRAVAGGGSGGGQGASGNNGTATTFNGVTANFGALGVTFSGQAGGAGGLGGTGGAGTAMLRIAGSNGGAGQSIGGGGVTAGVSGAGGSSALMGGAPGLVGHAPAANTGAGGSGASGTNNAQGGSGGGGGGEYFETWMAAPATTYTYAVGAGGAAVGGSGAGSAGRIIVEEFYA